MKVSYFPGCTLKTKAKKLDYYSHKCAQKLGIELCEAENWQCCGGVYVNAKDEIVSKLASIRALIQAKNENRPLITVCSACHNVIKQSNHAMKTDKDFAYKVNAYLSQDGNDFTAYNGETKVYHYLEFLRDVVGFDKIKKTLVNPLSKRKLAAYYGCMLLRPGKVMNFDDVENPKIMEQFIKSLGAEPVIYSMRNECCGGYVCMESKEFAFEKSNDVICSAVSQGAEMIVTACPLCKYNLSKLKSPVPVGYFTQLLAEALGIKDDFVEE